MSRNRRYILHSTCDIIKKRLAERFIKTCSISLSEEREIITHHLGIAI